MQRKFKNINHVTVVVKDKTAAEKFYSEVLGFEKIWVSKKMLWMRVSNEFIHITEDKGYTQSDTFGHFAVNVVDFHAYLSELLTKGVDILDADADGKMTRVDQKGIAGLTHAFVRDPSCNLVEFVDCENEFFNQ